VVGTWSSVFTATPLSVEFLQRWPGRGQRARPAAGSATRRAPRDSGARV
jgi:hypothetical protein